MRSSKSPFLTRVLSFTNNATTYPETFGAMTTTLPSVYASSVVTRLRRANQTKNAATAATATTMPRMIRGFLLRGRSGSPPSLPSFPFDSARASSSPPAARASPCFSGIPTSGLNATGSKIACAGTAGGGCGARQDASAKVLAPDHQNDRDARQPIEQRRYPMPCAEAQAPGGASGMRGLHDTAQSPFIRSHQQRRQIAPEESGPAGKQ